MGPRDLEFNHLGKRYMLSYTAGVANSLEPWFAAEVLGSVVRSDRFLEVSLGTWMHGQAMIFGVGPTLDRRVLIEGLLRSVRAGSVRLIDLGESKRVYTHTYTARKPAREPSDTAPVEIAEPDLRFEVRVVDEYGGAIEGVQLEWSQGSERGVVATLADGVARFERREGPSLATLHFNDLDALRETMRPRWDRLDRSPGTDALAADENVSVASLTSALDRRGFAIMASRPHTISIQPKVVLARLFGPTFESSKSFVLPDALARIAAMRRLVDEHLDSCVLLVGHTDARSEPKIRDRLSLERAETVAAILRNDVDAWIERYEEGTGGGGPWGTREDGLMMTALLAPVKPPGVSSTLAFQRWFNAARGRGELIGELLAEDGSMGPKTRRALVTAYHRRAATSLADDIELTAHGAGDHFPVESSSGGGEHGLTDDGQQPSDQRVELFLFDAALGVQPPLTGDHSEAGSRTYPNWRHRAVVVQDFHPAIRSRKPVIPLVATGFRRGSSFVGPGLAATLEPLRTRLSDDLATLAVFGHSDSSGSGASNKLLAERRAVAMWALVSSDADALFSVAEDEGWGLADYQAMLRGLGFIPGAIDGESGLMTAAAIDAFGQAHTEGWLVGPAPSPGSKLDTATRRAIVSAYVEQFGLQLAPERLLSSAASGCREYNAADGPAARQRRVTLAVYSDPLTSPSQEEFPCVGGESSACALDRGEGRRCEFYRGVVTPELVTEPVRWFDFAWQRTPTGKVHLSALTTSPDTDEVSFEVGIANGGLPLAPPSSASFGAPVDLRTLATVGGLVRNGVCYALWDPQGFDPFDPRQWFDHDPEADEVEGLPVPTFVIRLGRDWAYATPPGRPLNRIALSGQVDREIVALLSDGSYARFSGREGLQEVAGGDALHVLALYPWDGLATHGKGQGQP